MAAPQIVDDSFQKDFKDAVAGALDSSLDYLVYYPAVVKSDNGDNTYDVICDNKALGEFSGLQKIPLRVGLPGTTVVVPVGSRVLVGFEEGNPSQPIICLFSAGTSMTEVAIGAAAVALAKAQEALDALEAIQTAFDAHVHPTAATGPPSVATPVPSVIPLSTNVSYQAAIAVLSTTKLKGE